MWKCAQNAEKNDNLQTIVWENFQMLYYLTSISNERWDFQLCKFTTLTPDNLGQEVNALFEKGHLTLKYSWILVIFKEVVDLFAVEVRGQFGGLCLAYYLFFHLMYCSSNVIFWKLLKLCSVNCHFFADFCNPSQCKVY